MLVRTTKHEDVDYSALSAHLFRCLFSRIPSVTISGFGGTSFVDQSCYFSLLFVMLRARLFIDALWSPAGKGLTSLLSFVMSNCEFVTFPLVSKVRCGT